MTEMKRERWCPDEEAKALNLMFTLRDIQRFGNCGGTVLQPVNTNWYDRKADKRYRAKRTMRYILANVGVFLFVLGIGVAGSIETGYVSELSGFGMMAVLFILGGLAVKGSGLA